MNITDEQGELVWDPRKFGSGDVGKLEGIAEILKNLLSEVTIKTEAAEVDISAYNVYSKDEVNTLLQLYVTIASLSDKVRDIIGGMVIAGQIWGPDSNDILILNAEMKRLTDSYDNLAKEVVSINKAATENASAITRHAADSDRVHGDLAADIVTLQGDMAGAKAGIGTLGSLSTTAKSSLVEAINELFTSASNGKSVIAAAITGKGVAASSSDSWQALADKIGQIAATAP